MFRSMIENFHFLLIVIINKIEDLIYNSSIHDFELPRENLSSIAPIFILNHH